MTTLCPAPHEGPARPALVKRLAEHLLQYPQDIVDTKRLIKSFHVSAHEFHQALLSNQQEEEPTAFPLPSPAASIRSDKVDKLVAHLLQYPQDLVDARRLIQRFRVSAAEVYQALLSIDSHGRGV